MFADRRSATGTITRISAPVAQRTETTRSRRPSAAADSGAPPPADASVLRALDCLHGDVEPE